MDNYCVETGTDTDKQTRSHICTNSACLVVIPSCNALDQVNAVRLRGFELAGAREILNTSVKMWIEDLLIVSFCLVFLDERLKKSVCGVGSESSTTTVVQHSQGKKRVSNEFCRRSVVGVATISLGRGRTVQAKNKQHWDYDSARGYPGEDISVVVFLIL